jgi:hypothetical protein
MDAIHIDLPGGVMRGFAYDARETSQLVEETHEVVAPDGSVMRGTSLRRIPREKQTPPDASE